MSAVRRVHYSVVASSAAEKPDPIDRASMDLRYPIGQYSPPATIGRAERDAWIAELEASSRLLTLEPAVARTASWPYRGWMWLAKHVGPHLAPTVRWVVSDFREPAGGLM